MNDLKIHSDSIMKSLENTEDQQKLWCSCIHVCRLMELLTS